MNITGIQATDQTLACASRFNLMWQRLKKEELPIATNAGNLLLILDPTAENTTLAVKQDQVVITAKDEKALFKGSMIFLQQVFSETLKLGLQEISPSQQQKLLMIDIGRKYFSLASLKEFVELLALFNFDQLQIHFSENEGFRIASDQYPWLASKEHLTKAEVRELIQFARAHYIEVIPDFDAPGHLKHALANKPEWRLPKLAEDGSLTKDEKALDILNPEAVAFVHSIYQEYGELFQDCHYFHIGADEFVPFDDLHFYPTLEKAAEKYGPTASGIEVLIEYVNQTAVLVKQLGFVPMVWSDGFYRINRKEGIHLDPECIVSYWTRWNQNMAPVEKYLQEGYQVINHNDNYFYYVLGEHASYDYPTYEQIMKDWQPVDFPKNQVISPEELDQVAANAISIWSNIPEAKTEKEVAEDIFYIAAALMQKADQRHLGDKDVIEKLAGEFF